MKKSILNIVFSVIALTAMLKITSCSDDEVGASETTLNKLTAHNWDLSRVTVGGVDQTSLYPDLSIQWTKDKTLSTTNGGTIWPSTSNFSFTDNTAKTLLVQLKNGENTEVTIETLTDSELVISLHWNETTFGQGRSKSIEGDHIFEFTAAN
jgi:hypothetical protein